MHDVFAFLDTDNPVVAWAVQRGVLVSSGFASPEKTVGFASMMLGRMIAYQNAARLFNEMVIEQVRDQRFSHQISRLKGMYFFASRDEAERRIGDRRWPGFFRQSNLVELRLWSFSSPTVVDADWITHAPLSDGYKLDTNDLSWIERYWNGEPRGSAPTWEVIAEGVAVILDEGLRRRCYDFTRESFPGAEIPLLMSRLASEAGTLGGVIAPFLLRTGPDVISLRYVMRDAEFHNQQVIERMAEHPDSGHLWQLMRENETWKMPDFREWGGEFQLPQAANLAEAEANSIHH